MSDLYVPKSYTMVYDDGEASTYFPTYSKASPADLVAAVRRGVESGTIEGVEPDYEAAMKPLDKFLHDDLWFPHERYAECRDIEGELVTAIVDAAVGGRLLVDPPKEEGT